MNSQPGTVAIIDDDFRVLESLVNLLSSFGYRTRSYLSAEQFLGSDFFAETCCVITDVEMKQMSGLGLLQHLKEIYCATPVIVITGKPSARTERFYLEKGAVGFFRKPVDSDALLKLIMSFCPLTN